MKSTCLKISKLHCIFIGLFCLCFHSISLHAALSNVDKLLDEARQKASIGDLDSAADLYQQVLALEKNHPDAKNELAVVLTGTQVSDNYIEETDDLKRDEVTKNTIQSSQ